MIWNIADGVLRDLYVRGKYRDVILPMTVLRRLVKDETQLFKECSDNQDFKEWIQDSVFRVTYPKGV